MHFLVHGDSSSFKGQILHKLIGGKVKVGQNISLTLRFDEATVLHVPLAINDFVVR